MAIQGINTQTDHQDIEQHPLIERNQTGHLQGRSAVKLDEEKKAVKRWVLCCVPVTLVFIASTMTWVICDYTELTCNAKASRIAQVVTGIAFASMIFSPCLLEKNSSDRFDSMDYYMGPA